MPVDLICLPQAGMGDMVAVKHKESEAVQNKITDKEYVVVLDEHGDVTQTSEIFAANIKQWKETYGDITFVIGGAYGLDDTILDRADLKIAFGKMVWTKDLVRLMLLEQMYRAGEINAGTGFHKA